MKRFTKLKGMYALLIAVAAVIGITIYESCSADEDFWGFDEECTSTENTRAEKMDMSEYLTLSSFNPDSWVERDLVVIGKAIQRIGVDFSKTRNRYEFQRKNGKTINISDSLYYCVVNMFEHTNNILKTSGTKRIKRIKMNREELPPIKYDCVPAAISHMGQYAQPYDDVVSTLDLLFHGWRNTGVSGTQIYTLFDLYAQNNYTICGLYDAFPADSVGLLESLVMTFPVDASICHAVNAVAFNTFGDGFICYNDYSSSSQGPGIIYFDHPMALLFMFVD